MNNRNCNPSHVAQKTSFFSLAVFCLLCFAYMPAGAVVKSYQRSGDGVTFRLQDGLMKINICRADIVEVKYTVLDAFPTQTSLVINNAWLVKPGFTVAEVGGDVVIATKKLKITVNKATNAIAYADVDGHPIVSEVAEGNKGMQAATIAGINTYNCATTFNSPADEGLFGLGCHPLDSLAINYKGRNQDLTIKYLTGAIPVLLSTKGYGLLWDNYSPSTFLGAEAGNTQFKYVCESGKMVDYYFFYGPDFDHIISGYRDATGKAPMYGKWAYGLFQSQDRYKWQKEVLAVKDNYRNNHIPVDVIVQDWYYWEPLPIGSHVMNAERYPNPKAMVDELHKANIHGMISIWPVFGSGTANFDALKASGGLTSVTWDNVVTHTLTRTTMRTAPKHSKCTGSRPATAWLNGMAGMLGGLTNASLTTALCWTNAARPSFSLARALIILIPTAWHTPTAFTRAGARIYRVSGPFFLHGKPLLVHSAMAQHFGLQT